MIFLSVKPDLSSDNSEAALAWQFQDHQSPKVAARASSISAVGHQHFRPALGPSVRLHNTWQVACIRGKDDSPISILCKSLNCINSLPLFPSLGNL
jgi:hypothetical protein